MAEPVSAASTTAQLSAELSTVHRVLADLEACRSQAPLSSARRTDYGAAIDRLRDVLDTLYHAQLRANDRHMQFFLALGPAQHRHILTHFEQQPDVPIRFTSAHFACDLLFPDLASFTRMHHEAEELYG